MCYSVRNWKPTDEQWETTNDENCQIVRRVGPAPLDPVFELYQVVSSPNGAYGISNHTVDVRKYSEQQLQEVVKENGYRDLDDFVMQLSARDDWVYHPDGSLDRDASPSYYYDFELLARMIFEKEASAHLLLQGFEKFEDAEIIIRRLTE